ncbi:type 1 pili tip component [Alkalilimnicola sp. S0819]|uniref:type 1 pili tip component n=1 Tax=Alkalilimnicola sp. S0819 TaxID=2613922 RepID=UPI0012624587|nr:type 1 pili tip component [Alkalilimnicola sp. S0819]KAB7628273.1 type 1 pili tip component [Alkalilimnicola sp. S0819]MPQ15169.1 type 1 pili tip component [Alkalilimnicola sp. S0819]
MKFKDLVRSWENNASEPRAPGLYEIRLPAHDAAKLAALAELYPGRRVEDLITDLLSTALDEVEATFPYVQGTTVVAEDEEGDPIYEDRGLTPKFRELTRKHLEQLKTE